MKLLFTSVKRVWVCESVMRTIIVASGPGSANRVTWSSSLSESGHQPDYSTPQRSRFMLDQPRAAGWRLLRLCSAHSSEGSKTKRRSLHNSRGQLRTTKLWTGRAGQKVSFWTEASEMCVSQKLEWGRGGKKEKGGTRKLHRRRLYHVKKTISSTFISWSRCFGGKSTCSGLKSYISVLM